MTTQPANALVVPGDDDFLSPFPVLPGGVLIGYAPKIFADKLSGKKTDRPELIKAMEYARAGDALVVTELSRLGRSLQDLIALVGEMRTNGIGFQSLKERLDTTTAGGRLVFHVFAALMVIGSPADHTLRLEALALRPVSGGLR